MYIYFSFYIQYLLQHPSYQYPIVQERKFDWIDFPLTYLVHFRMMKTFINSSQLPSIVLQNIGKLKSILSEVFGGSTPLKAMLKVSTIY